MSQDPVQLDLLDWLPTPAPCPALADPSPSPPALDEIGPELLTRVDPSCNMRRFSSVALATSLFGKVGMARQ